MRRRGPCRTTLDFATWQPTGVVRQIQNDLPKRATYWLRHHSEPRRSWRASSASRAGRISSASTDVSPRPAARRLANESRVESNQHWLQIVNLFKRTCFPIRQVVSRVCSGIEQPDPFASTVFVHNTPHENNNNNPMYQSPGFDSDCGPSK